MPYPNSLKEFAAELFEDHFGEFDRLMDAPHLVEAMTEHLKDFKMDEERKAIKEILKLIGEPDREPTPMDYVEASFRTLLLNMFHGPSYTPIKETLAEEHMRLVHGDGTECEDGCDKPVIKKYR